MANIKILLVEGLDDYHVVINLQGEHQIGILDKDDIHGCGGIQPLLQRLPTDLKAADDGVVGIVIDADQNLAARWHSVMRCLREAGYKEIPDAPSVSGVILNAPPETTLPKFGAWVMPDNMSDGVLENFIGYLVPQGDVLFPYAQTTLDGLPEQRFSANAKPKALIYTWLAWQSEPGRPFGQAIKAGFLRADSNAGNLFVGWLRLLFSD